MSNLLKSKYVTKAFPFLEWFPMSGGQIRADVLAGITVALVLIPQSMAYAQLAGLPAFYGLYAAFLPVIIGALWGSSRHLATGPVAVVSLLTASALAPLAGVGTEAYIALAILLTFMIGFIQVSLGLLRMGTIVNLLSHPVILGFVNAAAIIIGLSQIDKIFGISIPRTDYFLLDIWGLVLRLGEVHFPTLVMGVGAFALMMTLKKFAPKVPNVLVAVVLLTVVSWYIGYERKEDIAMERIQDTALVQTMQNYLAKMDILADLESAAATSRSSEAQLLLLRDELDEYQQRLRQTQFIVISAADGSSLLHTADTIGNLEHEVHRWRIREMNEEGIVLAAGGRVVGDVPAGLPKLTVPSVTWSDITSLLSIAFIIALIGYMEAISIAKAIAAKTRSRIDPDRELIGQGLANLASGASQGYPVSGSFSRSAVNYNAGAVTGLASVVSGLLVMLTLLFFTGLLYHLPQAVLAAIIMMAVAGLINFKAIVHAWQTHKHDGIAATVTFVATLLFAPQLDIGIVIGAAVAIMLFLRRRMRPRTEILSENQDGVLAGMDTHNLQPMSKHFVPVRFDGELTFVNVNYFEDMVLDVLKRFPESKAILLVGSSINEIDVSGEEKLRELAASLKQSGVEFYLSGLKAQVVALLEKAHIHEVIPREHFFSTKSVAIKYLKEKYPQQV